MTENVDPVMIDDLSTSAVLPVLLTTAPCVTIISHSEPIPSFLKTLSPPPIRGMANHLRSTRVCMLFDTALQTYEKNVGVTLVEHPLALRLQSCHSVESITTVLQDQVQAFSDLRRSGRIIKSVKSTVSNLTKHSTVTSPALDIGLVRQKAPMPCSPALTVSIAISTCDHNIHWSRHLNFCLYHFLLYKYSCDVQAN